MIKLLLGGSPCTFWSIAQKNGRETEASGMGWELFKNYLIAKDKFKPDFFLYENNKSAAQPIKDQISTELGVDLMYINSALVSAQNRQRFYAFNWEVEQPEDRGILLRDIIESGVVDREKAYPLLTTHQGNARDYFKKGHAQIVCEPVKYLTEREMDYMVRETRDGRNHFDYGYIHDASRDKSQCITANMHKGVPYNVLCEPVGLNVTDDGKSQTIKAQYDKTSIPNICCYNSTYGATGIAMPTTEPPSKPFTGSGKDWNAMKRVYEVKDGFITIKDKQYPIKLADGNYLIRKLTVNECCRLQTLPDNYCRAVSNTQAYKGLGNGWTAEVIIHILNGALKNVPRDEEVVVLSMYDGIGTGRYCLDKMGFTNVKYFAYEIDKYAKQVSMSNYPDIIQLGDAFDLRHPDWTIGY